MPKKSPEKSMKALAASISDFVSTLTNPTAEHKSLTDKELFDAFRDIYQRASHVDRAELMRLLPDKDKEIFDVLYLGYVSREQKGDPSGFSRLIKLVVDHPDFQRLAMLVEFNKSPEGHVFSNLGSMASREKLEKVFSSYAPPVVRHVLRSLRAEEMGRLLGYVAAGRMEPDIERYNALGAQKGTGQPMEAWLLEQIRACDAEFVISFGQGVNRLNDATGHFTGSGAPKDKVREESRPDHCFMEYYTDPKTGQAKVCAVHIGSSTSVRSNASIQQGISAITNMAALVNSTMAIDSDLAGVEVRPYYYLAGVFCVDEAVSRGKSFSHALLSSDVPRKSRIALAQMQFLSLISCNTGYQGSTSAHPDRTLALLAHNPFISGCDTLDLHGLAFDIQDAIASGMTPQKRAQLDRLAMNMLADKIIDATEGLLAAMPKLFVNARGTGNRRDSDAILEALLTTAYSFTDATRFDGPEDLARLEEVRQSMIKLHEALEERDHEMRNRARDCIGALSMPARHKDAFALSRAFSNHLDGMPKSLDTPVVSNDARLRETLRQVADHIRSSLPARTLEKHRPLLEMLLASPNTSGFVGLADHRVSWRRSLDDLSRSLRAKKVNPDLIEAIGLIQEKSFVGRKSNEIIPQYEERARDAQNSLMEGLEALGYGFKPALPQKVKKMVQR